MVCCLTASVLLASSTGLFKVPGLDSISKQKKMTVLTVTAVALLVLGQLTKHLLEYGLNTSFCLKDFNIAKAAITASIFIVYMIATSCLLNYLFPPSPEQLKKLLEQKQNKVQSEPEASCCHKQTGIFQQTWNTFKNWIPV